LSRHRLDFYRPICIRHEPPLLVLPPSRLFNSPPEGAEGGGGKLGKDAIVGSGASAGNFDAVNTAGLAISAALGSAKFDAGRKVGTGAIVNGASIGELIGASSVVAPSLLAFASACALSRCAIRFQPPSNVVAANADTAILAAPPKRGALRLGDGDCVVFMFDSFLQLVMPAGSTASSMVASPGVVSMRPSAV
jgi:hypothetical protein